MREKTNCATSPTQDCTLAEPLPSAHKKIAKYRRQFLSKALFKLRKMLPQGKFLLETQPELDEDPKPHVQSFPTWFQQFDWVQE